MMSSHLALPREGHLEHVLHIFAYLKKYHNTELVYDPSDPVVDENDFKRRDWAPSEFGHVEGKKSFLPICLNLEVMDSLCGQKLMQIMHQTWCQGDQELDFLYI